MRKKEEAGIIFEEYIRKYLRACDFNVLKESKEISEQNEKYEFDVIGVNNDSMEIVLVEAKYHDFSPSSLTGENIVPQELLDAHIGLLKDAKRHQARLDFFRSHPKRFEHELPLTFPIEKYSPSAWIVTKYTPLICKYKEVLIVVFNEFCEKFTPTT